MFESIFSCRGLSLDRLKTLLEVEAAGSISGAGKAQPRQSQYSRQLKELSEYFGLELTVRRGKYMKLTEAGARIASLARQFLSGLENFKNEARALPINIKIGAGDSLVQWLIIPRLGGHPSPFRKFQFEVISLQTREIAERLGDARLDFGIVRENARPAGAKSLTLGNVSYSVFVPRGMIRGKELPSLADVMRNCPMALQVTDGQFTERLRKISEAMEIHFAPALSCQSLPQATAAVRSGAYAAILPTLAATELRSGTFIEVSDRALASLTRKVALMWNPRIAAVRPELAAASKDLADAFRLRD
jgi:LysR family transcriptional regulator, nitrogen assimilation regulatory protein